MSTVSTTICATPEIANDRRAAAPPESIDQLSDLCAGEFAQQRRDAVLPGEIRHRAARDAAVEHARKPSPPLLARAGQADRDGQGTGQPRARGPCEAQPGAGRARGGRLEPAGLEADRRRIRAGRAAAARYGRSAKAGCRPISPPKEHKLLLRLLETLFHASEKLRAEEAKTLPRTSSRKPAERRANRA